MPKATLKDLDKKALEKAREMFKKVHSHLEEEVDEWNDWTFLQNAGIAYDNQLTRAALLLLGKENSQLRNATSHAKFIFEWAPVNETIIFVLE